MKLGLQRSRAGQADAYGGFLVLGALVCAMWVVELVNALDAQRLSSDGIIARRLSGLPGVLTAPFLHAGWGHLIANTIPFVILGLVIAASGAAVLIEVTVIAAIVGGLGAWALSASGSDTIGASGIVFGYATFLIARGFFTRRVAQILVGVLVAVLFGAALVASVVPQSGISWQDHVFGGLGGVIAAWGTGRKAPQNE
jgi:membrane associated rhomboid family serine protease